MNSRRLPLLLLPLALLLNACGGAGNLPRRNPDGIPDNAVSMYVIVEVVDEQGRMLRRPVHVKIDAVDNFDRQGQWLDTDVDPAVPRPYPKETDEETRYQHPIYYDPRLTITVVVTASFMGRKGEVLQCYVLGPGGVELRGSFNKSAVRIPKTGKVDIVKTSVICFGNSLNVGP